MLALLYVQLCYPKIFVTQRFNWTISLKTGRYSISYLCQVMFELVRDLPTQICYHAKKSLDQKWTLFKYPADSLKREQRLFV